MNENHSTVASTPTGDDHVPIAFSPQNSRFKDVEHVNDIDINGNPRGGFSAVVLRKGDGIDCERRIAMHIVWQAGPIKAVGINGVQIEDVLEAVRQRLEFLQTASDGKFACAENEDALLHITAAVDCLNDRTARRIREKTEGTNEGQ